MTQKERVAGICNTIIENLEKAEKGKKVLYLYTKSDYPAHSIVETVTNIMADKGKIVECSIKGISPLAMGLIFTIKK